MFRFALVALLLSACGKGKEPSVGQGSAGSGSSGSAVLAPVAVALPTVAGDGYEATTATSRVSVTPSAIVVDGTQVLALAAGVPPADALQAEKLPAVINGLSAPSSAPRFVLALDKTIEYRLLVQLITTLKTQGLTSYGLLAQKAGGETVLLPIDLPAPTPVEPPPKRAPGSDLQRQLDEAKAAGDAVKVGSAHKTGMVDESDATPGAVVVEVRDVSLTPESSLSNEIAKAKVSATYLPGLRRCVRSFAVKDATRTSSFTVTFTINETGTGVDAKAIGVTNEAADCIAGQAATWRFPIPKDADRKGVKVNATATFDITVDEEAVKATNADALPGPSEAAPASNVGLVLSITADAVIVWSTSGLEGTLDKPRLRHPVATVDAAHHITAVLADIGKRRPEEHEITVIVDPSTKMQVVAMLLGAARATSAGTRPRTVRLAVEE